MRSQLLPAWVSVLLALGRAVVLLSRLPLPSERAPLGFRWTFWGKLEQRNWACERVGLIGGGEVNGRWLRVVTCCR